MSDIQHIFNAQDRLSLRTTQAARDAGATPIAAFAAGVGAVLVVAANRIEVAERFIPAVAKLDAAIGDAVGKAEILGFATIAAGFGLPAEPIEARQQAEAAFGKILTAADHVTTMMCTIGEFAPTNMRAELARHATLATLLVARHIERVVATPQPDATAVEQLIQLAAWARRGGCDVA